jgi:hypothetical protein
MTFARFNKTLTSPATKTGKKTKPATGIQLLLSTMDSTPKPPIKLSKKLIKKLKKFFKSRLLRAFNRKGKRVTTLKLTGEDLVDFETRFFGSSKDLATLKNAIRSIDEILLSGDTIVTSACRDYATPSPIGSLKPRASSTNFQFTPAELVTAVTSPRNKFSLWVFNEDGMEGRVALTADTHLGAYIDERAANTLKDQYTQRKDDAKIELSIIDTPREKPKTPDNSSSPKDINSTKIETIDQDQLETSQDQLVVTQDQMEISQDHPENPKGQLEVPQDQLEASQDQTGMPQDHLENPQDHLENPQDHLENPQDHLENPQDHLENPQDHLENPQDHPESPRDQFETTTVDTTPRELEAFNQDALEQADLNNTDSTRTDTSDELATATPTTASTSSATGTLDDIAKPKDLDERANDYKMINKIYDNIVLCIDTNTTWKYIEPPASLSQVTRDEVEPATTASPGQAGILVFQAPANLESRAKYSAKPLATKTYIKSRTIRIGDNDTNFTSRPFHLHARNEKVSGINIFNSIAFN